MKTTREQRDEFRTYAAGNAQPSLPTEHALALLDDLDELELHNLAQCAVLKDAERERDELKANGRARSAAELLSRGGEWLAAARRWIQRHKHNGDSVTWGSSDALSPPMTVAEVEDLASDVAEAAMTPQPTEKYVEACLRARLAAEARVERAEKAIRDAHAWLLDALTLSDGEINPETSEAPGRELLRLSTTLAASSPEEKP